MGNDQTRVDDIAPEHDDRLDLPPEKFIKSLTPEDVSLLRLRDELYERSWDRMAADLQNRLTGRPYIFRLVNHIEDDLVRIKLMRAFETRHGLDLGSLLERR